MVSQQQTSFLSPKVAIVRIFRGYTRYYATRTSFRRISKKVFCASHTCFEPLEGALEALAIEIIDAAGRVSVADKCITLKASDIQAISNWMHKI